jgi:hypothetical protein
VEAVRVEHEKQAETRQYSVIERHVKCGQEGYAPNVVEGEVCELRLDGVLRKLEKYCNK